MAQISASRRRIAALCVNRHRRTLIKWMAAKNSVKAEHSIKMGEKAVRRYRAEGILI